MGQKSMTRSQSFK